MSKWNDSPFVRINTFVTAGLRTEQIIPQVSAYVTDTDTQADFALPFMIPGGETTESNTPFTYQSSNPGAGYTELPYCIYSATYRPLTDQPYMYFGQISYSLYHSDIDLLFEMSNYINDLCKREDWSAADCNDYFSKNDTSNPWDFKYICTLHSAGPVPPDDEGGRSMYLIVIRFECTYEGPGRSGVEPFAGGIGMIN